KLERAIIFAGRQNLLHQWPAIATAAGRDENIVLWELLPCRILKPRCAAPEMARECHPASHGPRHIQTGERVPEALAAINPDSIVKGFDFPQGITALPFRPHLLRGIQHLAQT